MAPSEEPEPRRPTAVRFPTGGALALLRRVSDLAASAEPRERALDEMAQGLVGALGCRRAVLYLLSPSGKSLAPAAWAGRGGCPSDLALDGGSPEAVVVRTRDAAAGPQARTSRPDGWGSGVLFVPVRAHGGVVGVLGAEPPGRRRRFRAEEVDVLWALADVAGLAVETRDLLQGNLAKIQQLLALQRVGRQMTSALDTESLLPLVVEEALHLTGADGASVYLREPGDKETLRLCARAGQPAEMDRETVSVGYGIVGWVARAGSGLRVSDRGAGVPDAGSVARKSQLAVPLLSEGGVLGVLAVEARREEAFAPTDEEILSIFASQAAKAIEASRLFQQIRAERDLREGILGGTPNGVVAVDQARRVTLVNEAARRFLRVRETPEGNPVERYLSAPDFLRGLRSILEGRSGLESLEVAVGSGEQEARLLVSIFSLGPGRGATIILQDLTERRRLDERVQRMARLASIGQLAAGIAHEIRNPLTGVAISLDILGQEEGLSGEGRSLLDDINREIDRLEALIRGILDFARPQLGEFRPMRVARALEWHRTFREQCRKKGVRLDFELRSNPKIEGDPDRLTQLFLNLAINALDAVSEGGEVRIWAEQVEETPHAWARVVVEDTGHGMDGPTLNQIFDPFFTTKREGTGLGLSIAYSVVEQHGGRMDVRSRPGEGTRFTVDLPAKEVG